MATFNMDDLRAQMGDLEVTVTSSSHLQGVFVSPAPVGERRDAAQTHALIMAYLQDGTPRTIRQVARALGRSAHPSLRALLYRLCETGELQYHVEIKPNGMQRFLFQIMGGAK